MPSHEQLPIDLLQRPGHIPSLMPKQDYFLYPQKNVPVQWSLNKSLIQLACRHDQKANMDFETNFDPFRIILLTG